MKLLREYINLFLIESRISDVQAKYPELNIHDLIPLDPSNNNKYLMWIAKQVEEEGLGADLEEIGNIIEKFHTKSRRLGKRDIYSYDSLYDLEKALQTVSEPSKTQKRKNIKAGANVIFEDDLYTVLFVETKKACQLYGSGTKWCITMNDEPHWEEYSEKNILFYYVIRNNPQGDAKDKIAVSVVRNQDTNAIKGYDLYDAEDEQLSTYLDSLNIFLDYSERSNITKIISQHAAAQPKPLLARATNGDLTPKEEVQLIKSLDDYDRDYMFGSVFPELKSKEAIDTLIALNDDTNEFNIVLAYNHVTPTVVLDEIAQRELKKLTLNKNYVSAYDTLNAIAFNPNISRSLISKLIEFDVDPSRRHFTHALAANVNLPIDFAMKIIDTAPAVETEEMLAQRTPHKQVMQRLIKSDSAYVRVMLLRNKNLPRELFNMLLHDKHSRVRSTATEKIMMFAQRSD